MEDEICKYCNRPIIKDPFIKKNRGKKNIYCSEFCFRLDFYNIPDITYKKLKEFYLDRTISVPVPNKNNGLRRNT